MPVLPVELRNKLERTIIEARDIAEAGAKTALEALAVHHYEPYGHMSPEERRLRNHLRARARLLGDKQNKKGELEITHLVRECAYEHWHRMLFARFLAENDLLIEPEMGVAISLEECEELAKDEGKDLWTLASEFAQRMLPQIFRTDDPILKVTFAREHRIKLEKLLDDLEPSIFTASDSLGWVYQFWQSKRKKEVNESGNKIGADELPAVTQLFTEPYMVSFLLDNSLGAWWAVRRLTKADLQNSDSEDELRHKAALPGVPLEYLRFIKLDDGTWTPAAGTFDGWPERLSELKILDPCCGSGHFLVTAFLMLVPMRMELESLRARDAVDAVLRENIHGLELDQRCVELAAFALALAAWRYPDAGGYRPLPELNVACSGLSISASKEDWLTLAGDNTNLRFALEELYKQFKDAPVLGSLINPKFGLAKGSLFEIKWEDVGPLLTKALSDAKDDEKSEMGVVAQGIANAAQLLSERFRLIITNVPYLARSKQNDVMRDHLQRHYNIARMDLATSFLYRCYEMCEKGGSISIVLPQNWLYQSSYKSLRSHILSERQLNNLVRLGEGGFESPAAAGAFVTLLTTSNLIPDKSSVFTGINVSDVRGASNKSEALRKTPDIIESLQYIQLDNPDSIISLSEIDTEKKTIGDYFNCYQGLRTGDSVRFIRAFWETNVFGKEWDLFQTTGDDSGCIFSGLTSIIYWESGCGSLHEYAHITRKRLHDMHESGNLSWGNKGIAISQMRNLRVWYYTGEKYDNTLAVATPLSEDEQLLLPALIYMSSGSYQSDVRNLNQSLYVTNSTLVKVPFDLEYWQKVAAEKYPNGLPKPYSDDPTQWIFHGHPCGSVIWNEETKTLEHGPLRTDATVLQVAVARLLVGYCWPAELDPEMELSDEQRDWVKKCETLLEYTDKDGIVCIPSVRGEEPAADRLRELLSAAFGPDWSPAREHELIRATGVNSSNLDEWLNDHFFEQHCKLFHHRPFIWHIWDGRRRDGFHALVNYHKLAEGNGKGRQLLENLTYSYLGDWITRQKEGVKRGEGGAEDRLAAALELQERLIAIIEGEPPFDIFVRWKPIEEQPIGWEPDINDGVRINIRPFMAQDIPGGRKGAGVLRWKPNIKWNKDRGKDVASAPWFPLFRGDRINDHHLSLEEKRAARAEANRREGEPGNGRGGETGNG